MRRKTLDTVKRARTRRLLENKVKAYFACRNSNNRSIINNEDGETMDCVDPKKLNTLWAQYGK